MGFYGWGGVIFTTPIDVTDYSKLLVTNSQDADDHSYVFTIALKSKCDAASPNIVTGNSTLDVSGLKGEYYLYWYVKSQTCRGRNAYIDNIMLIK